jgi:uncharacterized membrane protein
MISVGAGFALVLVALYLLFFAARSWVRIVGAAYIGVVVIVAVIGLVRGNDPKEAVFVLTLVVVFALIVSAIHRNWKNWP